MSLHFGFELVERKTLVSIGWVGGLLCLVRSAVRECEWTQYVIGVLTRMPMIADVCLITIHENVERRR